MVVGTIKTLMRSTGSSARHRPSERCLADGSNLSVVRDLPAGNVTMLFTDIEGSTRLLEEQGERYYELLGEHHRLIRAAIALVGGHEVNTEGDAFFVAFESARNAVAAAEAAQRSLAAHAWPPGVKVSVRMGIHTGEPTLAGEDYVGLDVHRAARICGAAHGGQVLLSKTTRELVDCHVRDLGEHRLKDLTEPQRLYQLLAEGLPTEFPPLRTLEHRPHNLPLLPTPLLGRERELEQAASLLHRTDVHLLTLTGPGGTGKTRLALQLAADCIDLFDDGVFFVALSAISDITLVLPTIAHAVGLRESGDEALRDTLERFLGDTELLLLLDNFEQVVEAAPGLAGLLASSAKLKLLVTSRERLQLVGEHEYAVPPLADGEAVALFAERVQATKHDFALTEANLGIVTEICARLDNLPLAIELSAARAKLLSPHRLLARLEQRLPLLTGGGRDLPQRQQTLRATIDWSYDLLMGEERMLFARLAVFAGGCSLEAAEEVCALGGLDVLEGLASLVDKSLVRQRELDNGESRFSLLQTMREYALERLKEDEEVEAVRRRHAAHYLALAEESEPEVLRGSQVEWLARLQREQDNFRAALAWSLDRSEVALALRLIGSLRRAWVAGGNLAETRRWLEAALTRGDGVSAPVRAKALYGYGRVALVQGDYAEAVAQLEQSAALFRELGDANGLSFSLADLGWISAAQGEYVRARAHAEEGLAVARAAGDTTTIAAALHSLACTMLHQREYVRARDLFEESLALRRALGDKRNTANSLSHLGLIALLEGDYAGATALLDGGLALAKELDNLLLVAAALVNLALVALFEEDVERSEALAVESLSLARRLGNKTTIVECLHVLAGIAMAQRQPLRTAVLSGAAEALHTLIGAPPSPAEQAVGERFTSTARAEVAEDAFAAAWEQGRTLQLEEALDYAVEGQRAATRRVM